MKTGLKLEDSQLSDYRRLGALSAVISVAAVLLLQVKWTAQTDGGKLLSVEEKQTPMVKILQKLHPPKGTPTYPIGSGPASGLMEGVIRDLPVR